MVGNLEPENSVMSSGDWLGKLSVALTELGMNDTELEVVIGGTQVSGIDVGEEYNKKWQSPLGTRKYNKDAFIVIRRPVPVVSSQPMDEFNPQHKNND